MAYKRSTRKRDAVEGAFAEALESLLVDKGIPYHQVTTSELCRTADFSRQTFYRHFVSIADVLDVLAAEYARELALSVLNERNPPTEFRDRMIYVFAFMDKRSTLLYVLKQEDMLCRYLTSFWSAYPWGEEAALVIGDDEVGRWLPVFATGALSSIISDRVGYEEECSPEKMGQIMEGIIKRAPQLVGFEGQLEAPFEEGATGNITWAYEPASTGTQADAVERTTTGQAASV